MLRTLARVLARRSATVLVLAILAVPILAVAGHGVRDDLSVGGFTDPTAESTVAAARLEAEFDAAPPNYVFVLSFTDGSVTDVGNIAAGREFVASVRERPGVLDVLSPWTIGRLPDDVRNPLESQTGSSAAVAVRLGGDEDDQRVAADALSDLLTGTDSFGVTSTGPAEVSRQAAEQAERDLVRAELIAVPLTLLGLLFVFRGWRAALIPLGVAVLAVLGTSAFLRSLTSVTTVSVFALNLTTGLGLGLAIDYSLLLVARFREERSEGREVDAAVSTTLLTAGRTVLFSAATVALSLLALLVFPIPYVRSFAYAGVAVVVIAAVAAIVVVPALLARFGHRIGVRDASPSVATPDDVWWGRQAIRVVRRPVRWSLGVVAVLIVVGLPFLGLDAGRIDERVLPDSNPARVAAEQLRDGFAIGEFGPIAVRVPWLDPSDPGDHRDLGELVDTLLALPHVARVDSALGFSTPDGLISPTTYNDRFRPRDDGVAANDSVGEMDSGTWLSVVADRDPADHAVEDLVRSIRSLDTRIEVSGTSATVVDTLTSVASRVPLALGLIALATLALLFMMTGSVVVPVKALLVNALSLTATFGSLVWIFQDGHLGSVLRVSPSGRLDVFTPILMLCVAFGLSMDYEVFLLARIKESYDVTGHNASSIVDGLGHTGRLVSAAAGLLAVVFVAIATSGVMTVKMFGFGLAMAVIVDAFLIRGTLVPAMMQVAGAANWWAPRRLRRLHLRWGLWERTSADDVDVAGHHGRRVLAIRLGLFSMFARCTTSDLDLVARHGELRVVDARAHLTPEFIGRRDAMVVVVSGRVAEVEPTDQDLSAQAAIHEAGSRFVLGSQRHASAPPLATLERTELAVFDLARFNVLCRTLPVDPSSPVPTATHDREVTDAHA